MAACPLAPMQRSTHLLRCVAVTEHPMAQTPNDKRLSRPKYTSDALIPGAFEGETITRRRLMTGGAHTAGAIAAAAFTLPALGFAIGPIFQRAPATWQDIGALSEFTD